MVGVLSLDAPPFAILAGRPTLAVAPWGDDHPGGRGGADGGYRTVAGRCYTASWERRPGEASSDIVPTLRLLTSPRRLAVDEGDERSSPTAAGSIEAEGRTRELAQQTAVPGEHQSPGTALLGDIRAAATTTRLDRHRERRGEARDLGRAHR